MESVCECGFLWERGFLLVLVCCGGGLWMVILGDFFGGGGGKGEGGRLMEWEGLDFGYV